MKYKSVNRLQDFEFHDAELFFEGYADGKLMLRAKFLNIHKGTEQNNGELDMELANAIMTFEGFRVLSYTEYGGSDNKENVFVGDEAKPALLEALKNGISLNGLEEEGTENGCTGFSFDVTTNPWLSATCLFETLTVEWDEYRASAWYEGKRKDEESSLFTVLNTPDGISHTQIYIHKTSEFNGKVLGMSATVAYNGRIYEGYSYCGSFSEAIADLQSKLPDGVTYSVIEQ